MVTPFETMMTSNKKLKKSEITPGVRTVDALKRLAEEIHGVKID
mgnify:CR=1 FL=1